MENFPIPIGLFIALELIFLVPFFAGIWKSFQKAGKPGWACIVPIYNLVVLLEIAEKPSWWLLMMCLPIANIVFAIKLYDAVSKKFGKDSGFTAGLILLPFVFWPILGFGNAVYQESRIDDSDLIDR